MERRRAEGCDQRILTPNVLLNLNSSTVRGENGVGYVYDCKRLRAYTYNVNGLRIAMDEFINIANQMSAATEPTDRKAICLANTLYAWARVNGLGQIEPSASEGDLRVARAVRSWNIGSYASAYIKLPSIRAAAVSLNRDAMIQRWFRRMGALVLEDVRAPYATEEDRHKKNIYFWKGYTLSALGIATENVELVTESRRIFDIAIGQIQGGNRAASDKGYMRFELLKKNRAHKYHIFALRPMLGMLNLSKAISCSFGRSDEVTGSLAQLIRKIAEGNKNPRVFEERTGYVQVATRAVEAHLSILQKDYQKTAILDNVRSYLADRNMTLDFTGVSAPSDNNMGGNVATLPAPGALGEIGRSSSFQELCARQILQFAI